MSVHIIIINTIFPAKYLKMIVFADNVFLHFQHSDSDCVYDAINNDMVPTMKNNSL